MLMSWATPGDFVMSRIANNTFVALWGFCDMWLTDVHGPVVTGLLA